MAKKDPFIDIRPYYDEELPYVVNRMLQSPGFINSITNFMPDVPLNVTVKRIRKISTLDEMQKKVFGPIIQTFEERSIDTLTFGGYEELPKNKAYLFVANHRDIVMDSAIMQEYLMRNGESACLRGCPWGTGMRRPARQRTAFPGWGCGRPAAAPPEWSCRSRCRR